MNSLSRSALPLTPILIIIFIMESIKPLTAEGMQSDDLSSEKRDRAVDQAALQSLDLAAKKMEALLLRYQKTAQEPLLLTQLAEVQGEASQIAFRIAHAPGTEAKQNQRIIIYQGWIKSQIQALTRLIESYPNDTQIDHAWFQRAKALEELKQKREARANYLKIIQDFKTSADLIPSYLALSELATQEQNYSESISFLLPIEVHLKNVYYPVALYKLAWNYYNLNQIPQAIQYLEKQIHYYNVIRDHSNALSSSDAAVRETSLMDLVVFFHDALEKRMEPYTLKTALPYFSQLEDGPFLGKIALRFAKLLRSHREDSSLVDWKNVLIQNKMDLTETLDVAALTLDHQLNQNQWLEMRKTLEDLENIFAKKSILNKNARLIEAIQKPLTEVASELQKQIANPKNLLQKRSILETLIKTYLVLIDATPLSDLKIENYHLNLAEAYFEITNFIEASKNYRWILNHRHPLSSLQAEKIESNWIQSKYEELKELKIIPIEIEAQALEPEQESKNGGLKITLNRSTLIKTLPTQALEWVEQIDQTKLKSSSSDEVINHMIYESNRLIYAKLSRRLAVEGLVTFAMNSPNSQYTPPSLALALDSLIKSADWSKTRQMAKDLSQIKWPKADLNERLRDLEMKSAYQAIEEMTHRREDSQALIAASEYLKTYPKSAQTDPIRYLMAQSQLRTMDKKGALQSLNLILNSSSNKARSDQNIFSLALIQRAAIFEESFQFEDALSDYQVYLALHPKDQNTLKKIPVLHWLAGNSHFNCTASPLEEVLESCQKYQALTLLHSPESSRKLSRQELPKSYQETALHGPLANRPIWAAIILAHSHELKLHEIIKMLKILAAGWKKLDSISQINLLPVLQSELHLSLGSARTKLMSEVPLKKVTPQTLVRRSEWIRELESAVTEILELPWARIRADALRNLSEVYQDLIHDLEKAPISKEMTLQERQEYIKGVREITGPFSQKSQDLHVKAYQLASQFSIEDEDWIKLRDDHPKNYITDSEALRQFLPQKIFQAPAIPIRLELANLNAANFFSDPLKKTWSASIQEHRWAFCSYLLQQMRLRDLITPTEEKLLLALTWSESGAKAEALSLLEEILPELGPAPRNRLTQIILSHYASTRAVERSRQLWNTLIRSGGVL